jgi:ATP-dependent 26S proteasome regulatory subunit
MPSTSERDLKDVEWYVNAGQPLKAAEIYEKVAKTFVNAGQLDKAEDCYVRVVELLVRVGHPDKAVEMCEKFADWLVRPRWHGATDAEMREKICEKATKICEKAAEVLMETRQSGKAAEVLANCAEWCEDARHPLKATELYTKAVVVRMEAGQFEGVVKMCNKAVKQHKKAGQSDKGIETYKKTDEKFAEMFEKFAETFVNAGQLDKAEDCYVRVVELLVMAGRPGNVAEMCEKFVERLVRPRWHGATDAEMREKICEKATKICEKAAGQFARVVLLGNAGVCYADCADMLMKAGKIGKATEMNTKACEKFAEWYVNAGQPDKAAKMQDKVKVLQSIVGVNKDNWEVRIQSAKTLCRGDETSSGINVKEPNAQPAVVGKGPAKGFECVAGMAEVKQQLAKKVITPLKHPENFERFGVHIPNGILLFGPPGCGKTFIVNRLAEELNYTFIEVNMSDLGSKYIYEAVVNIGKVFAEAKNKCPAILFFDEIDSWLSKRANMSENQSYKADAIAELLKQLNNASKNKVLVVGATNCLDRIDKAALRAGRFDIRIEVPPPDLDARRELFKKGLSDRHPDNDVDFDHLARITAGFTCADIIDDVINSAALEAGNLAKKYIDQALIEDEISRVIEQKLLRESPELS